MKDHLLAVHTKKSKVRAAGVAMPLSGFVIRTTILGEIAESGAERSHRFARRAIAMNAGVSVEDIDGAEQEALRKLVVTYATKAVKKKVVRKALEAEAAPIPEGERTGPALHLPYLAKGKQDASDILAAGSGEKTLAESSASWLMHLAIKLEIPPDEVIEAGTAAINSVLADKGFALEELYEEELAAVERADQVARGASVASVNAEIERRITEGSMWRGKMTKYSFADQANAPYENTEDEIAEMRAFIAHIRQCGRKLKELDPIPLDFADDEHWLEG